MNKKAFKNTEQSEIRFLYAMIAISLLLIAAMGCKIDRLSEQLVDARSKTTCYIFNSKEETL